MAKKETATETSRWQTCECCGKSWESDTESVRCPDCPGELTETEFGESCTNCVTRQTEDPDVISGPVTKE